MARVMMRCPLPATKPEQNGNPEFFTGLDIPRRQGLKNTGTQIVPCPICSGHHYLRKAYFEGDEQGLQHFEGLESAPPFAMEIGIIVSTVSFAEAYIPQVYCKITGMRSQDGIQVFGSISSVGQKIRVMENYRNLLGDNLRQMRASEGPRDEEHFKSVEQAFGDLDVIIAMLRKCFKLRDHYAHAKYNAGGYPDGISMLPYFGDFGKREEPVFLSLDELREDAELILRYKIAIRNYILTGERPKR